ncbi:hypothetical protein GCM10027091_01510 [Streptomyces daliensis]
MRGADQRSSSTGPWIDRKASPFERTGWRVRAAELHDEEAFAVTYWVCNRCCRAWVEWPYTAPDYQRCGLARAGLAALRSDNPGVAWHTLGGHEREAVPFWQAMGDDVPGSYEPRESCEHDPQNHG